ncbi:MAG: hypothetical protein CL582_16750 [Alteromonadaceae bacterium]|nr:hypothetical protein [Alteromonadaceae bacterium]
MTAEEYNIRSMAKFGWTRVGLGLPMDATFDEITDFIRDFQKSQGLVMDGRCGPDTWRRLRTYAEHLVYKANPDAKGFILSGGVLKPVPFKSIPCSLGSAHSLIGEGGHSHRSKDPTQVVWHWDAALSSESCYRVLKERGLSCHGGIDNDGTFIQYLDFRDHVGWHAGNRRVNKRSIGFEISNAVYLEYQKYYAKRWGERPILSTEVHGRQVTLLGFYESQIRTCIYLSSFIYNEFDIPLVHPNSTSIISNPWDFEGHMAHLHITEDKWDVAGFPWDYVMKEAIDE